MIIIDIDMPTGCSSCPIYDGEYGECQLRTCFPSRFVDVHALFDDRPNNCPLKDRPHGEWIDTTGRNDLICSVCKHKAQIGCIEYCGACGADMRKKEGEKNENT